MRRTDFCPECQMDFDLCERFGCRGDGEGRHQRPTAEQMATWVMRDVPAQEEHYPLLALYQTVEPVELTSELNSRLNDLLLKMHKEFQDADR